MKFEAFEVCLLGLQQEPFLRSYFIQFITFIALEKCEKKRNKLVIILIQGFCPLKIKITQFPNGFYLNSFSNLPSYRLIL